jgi:hypothetical protein
MVFVPIKSLEENMEKVKIGVYMAARLAILSAVVSKNMKGSAQYLSLLAIVGFAALFFGVSPALGATAPTLGTAQSYGVLGSTTVTNTGLTVVFGDLGVSPGTAITGFPPGIVTGTIHSGDAAAGQAQSDVTTAYNNLAGQAVNFGPFSPTDLAGQTLVPGVYKYSLSVQNTGVLTLNAMGDPNAVWVFQIGSTLTAGSGSSVVVINGGQDCNVFWQVGSSATLGTTKFVGNILALTSITLNNGANVSGRALARNGAVTMDTNVITPSSCGIPVVGITLTPVNATNPVGTNHTVTATLTNLTGVPQPGVTVIFSIISGPNSPFNASGTTNTSGQASFTYTGSGGVGTDNITACLAGQVVCSQVVTKDWIAAVSAKGSISGTKYNDLNHNGTRDAGELGLANWTITLTNSTGSVVTKVTDVNGSYKFANLTDGNYTVGEVKQSGWTQTAPKTGTYNVTIIGGSIITGKDFGNFQNVVKCDNKEEKDKDKKKFDDDNKKFNDDKKKFDDDNKKFNDDKKKFDDDNKKLHDDTVKKFDAKTIASDKKKTDDDKKKTDDDKKKTDDDKKKTDDDKKKTDDDKKKLDDDNKCKDDNKGKPMK